MFKKYISIWENQLTVDKISEEISQKCQNSDKIILLSDHKSRYWKTFLRKTIVVFKSLTFSGK